MYMNKITKIIVGGLFVSVIFPLLFTPQTMFPWGYGKELFFVFLIACLGLLSLPILWKYKNTTTAMMSHITMVDVFFLLFICSFFLSTFLGFEPVRSFWGDQSRGGGALLWGQLGVYYVFLRIFFQTKKQWRYFGMGIIGVGLVGSLIAWLGAYTSAFSGVIMKSSHLSGLAGNPIFFASSLIPPLYVSLSFLFVETEKWKRYIFGGVAGILLITLLATQVRGAFLGLLVSLVSMGVYFTIAKKAFVKKRRISVLLSLVVSSVLIVGLIFWNTRTSVLAEVSPTLSRMFTISTETGTGQTRLMAWKIALRGAVEHPVLGWGPESFQFIFDTYYNPAFLRFSFSETVWDRPHNFFLSILTGQGLVGLSLYLFFLALLAGALFKKIRQEVNPAQVWFLLFLFGGIVNYVVQSFFGVEVFHSLIVWVAFLAYVSFVIGSNTQSASWFQGSHHKSIVLVGAGILLLCTPWILFTVPRLYQSSVAMASSRDIARSGNSEGWKESVEKVVGIDAPIQWEQARYIVQDISYLDGAKLLKSKDLSLIAPKLLNIFETDISRNPKSYQYYFWTAELYGFMGEYMDSQYLEKNKEFLLRAGEHSPTQQRIPLLLAKNDILNGNVDGGVERLHQLLDTDPSIAEVRWFYGLALIEQGNKDSGLEELEASGSFGFTVDSNIVYVIDLYAQDEQYEHIIPLYQLLIQRHPGESTWYARIAATYAAMGQRDNVIEAINTAVELDPSLKTEAMEFLQSQGISSF
ncbi:MAG: hypothetical protein AUJ37_01195 [Candidatus Magasanikbacteria bacterium CG1_02_41_34]|nr:MAG: hypothetical protein AUJ37_01195 [Candidatus Magasanikbacteria bacterium CG1_02_41_34]